MAGKRGKTSARGKPKARRRNPPAVDRREYARAAKLAESIHGDADKNVVYLSAKERQLPALLTVLGRSPGIAYDVKSRKSNRQGRWYHEAGDRGAVVPSRRGRRPLLAINPKTKRPVIVPMGSGMRLKRSWLEG